MIVNCVFVQVKPEVVSKFIEATVANHQETIKEKGNLRFDLIQQADDPCKFMIYEAFVSEQGAAEHKTTNHYAKWRDLVSDFMAEPRKGIKYNIIAPSEISKW